MQLPGVLTKPAAIQEARALLAEQVGTFKLERVFVEQKASLVDRGGIGFFEEETFTRVGGAGGGKWTERLSVRFEWLAAA
jgi:hypothetical protein